MVNVLNYIYRLLHLQQHIVKYVYGSMLNKHCVALLIVHCCSLASEVVFLYGGISMTKFNNLKVKRVQSNLKYTESKLVKKYHSKRKKYQKSHRLSYRYHAEKGITLKGNTHRGIQQRAKKQKGITQRGIMQKGSTQRGIMQKGNCCLCLFAYCLFAKKAICKKGIT